MERIGVLHPGAMGAAIGGELVAAGHEVCWLPSGRSAETRARAEAAGLRPVDNLTGLSVVLSVCPPAAASAVAASVASEFDGLYVDANAIAPERVRAIAGKLPTVDGGIVGPPPGGPGRTFLYLSGAGARRVAELFAGTRVEARVLDGEVGQASALKLAFAAYNKMTFALAAQSYALASAHGVRAELGELAEATLPGTPLAKPAFDAVASKAWRWGPEMLEVAAACAEVGLDPAFGEAAAASFARWDGQA